MSSTKPVAETAPLADAPAVGASQRQVTWAIGLGVLAGFLVGPHLTFAAALLAALALNVSLPVFAASACAGMLAGRLLLPLCAVLGQRLLDGTSLGQVLARCGDGAFVALWDFDRYAVVGLLVVGAVFGLVAAEAARLVLRFVLPSWQCNSSPAPLWRPRGGYIVGMAAALIGAALVAIGPTWLGHRLLHQASLVNGADVTADTMRVNLLTGRLEAQRLWLADPANLSRNRLEARQVHGKLHVGQLLRGRLHVEHLQLYDVDSGTVRPVPARAWGAARPMAAKPAAPAHAVQDGCVNVERYLADAEAIRVWCRGAEGLLTELESLRPARPATGAAAAPELPLAQRRSRLGRALATLQVQRVHLEELPTSWKLGARAVLQLSNVTSEPKRSGAPTGVLVIAPAAGLALEGRLNLHDAVRQHELRLQSYDVRPQSVVHLARLADVALPSDLPGCLAGQGWFDRQSLHVQLALAAPTAGLQIRSTAPLAGLPPQLWQQAATQIDRIELPLQLVGSLTQPRLELDPATARQRFQQQLAAAGQSGWSQAIADELSGASQFVAQRQPQTVHPAAEAPADVASSETELAHTEAPQSPAVEPAPETEPAPAPPAAEAPEENEVAAAVPQKRQPQPALVQAVPIVSKPEPQSQDQAAISPTDETPSAAPPTAAPAAPVLQPVAVQPPATMPATADAPPNSLTPELAAVIDPRDMPGLKDMQLGFDYEATRAVARVAPPGFVPQPQQPPQVAQQQQRVQQPPQVAQPQMPPQGVAGAVPMIASRTAPPAAPPQVSLPPQPAPDANADQPAPDPSGLAAGPRRWWQGLKTMMPGYGRVPTPEQANLPPPEARVASLQKRPAEPAPVASDAATASPAERQPISSERSWKFWR